MGNDVEQRQTVIIIDKLPPAASMRLIGSGQEQKKN